MKRHSVLMVKGTLSVGALFLMVSAAGAQTVQAETTIDGQVTTGAASGQVTTGSSATTEGTVIQRRTTTTTVGTTGQTSTEVVGGRSVQAGADTDVSLGGEASQTGVVTSGVASSRSGYSTAQTRRVYRTIRTYRTVPVYRAGRVVSSRRVYSTRRVYRTVPVRGTTYQRARRSYARTGA